MNILTWIMLFLFLKIGMISSLNYLMDEEHFFKKNRKNSCRHYRCKEQNAIAPRYHTIGRVSQHGNYSHRPCKLEAVNHLNRLQPPTPGTRTRLEVWVGRAAGLAGLSRLRDPFQVWRTVQGQLRLSLHPVQSSPSANQGAIISDYIFWVLL